VVFDMDGVLVDTEPVSRRVLADIYARFGQQVSAPLLDGIIGVHIDEAIQLLSSAYPIPLDLAQVRAEYENTYLPRLATCSLAAGVGQLLASIAEHRIPLGLASSASRAEIDTVLRANGVDGVFGAVCSGDDVANKKPHPEIYRAALARLGVGPDGAVAVEDSPYGVSAAVDAGMLCVGLRSARAPQLDLSRAHCVLDSLSGQSARSLWLAVTGARTASP
jgi:beta-phosphoglucomutase-like phosphatase (HAD superfamily)